MPISLVIVIFIRSRQTQFEDAIATPTSFAESARLTPAKLADSFRNAESTELSIVAQSTA
jgi:hypothetical protein